MMTTKLYQIDTYLKEWDARILAAKPAADGDCLIQLGAGRVQITG